MKVLIGCSSPPDRGAGILAYAKEISTSFISRGITVYFASPTPRDPSWFEQLGIRHVPTDQDQNQILRARQVLSYIREEEIEAVINNDNSLLQSIAPGLPCPFIAVGHMIERSIASLACFRPEWSDHVIAISNDMQRAYVHKFGIPVTKCPIVYNGVQDRGGPTQVADRKNHTLRLLFAGGLTKLKGGDLVLSAVLKDQENWRGISLDWVGGVPDRIIKLTAGLPHVRIHGQVPHQQLQEMLKHADVLLFPSRLEGCPMAMLEAMSQGVVPIASDGIGAMRWLITSGNEGYICHLDRWPQQMMECITHLRDHPDVLLEMQQTVYSRFLADFQVQSVTENLLKLIRQPTVNRTNPAKRFQILRWHRPLRADKLKAPMLDRVCYRLGILRSAGILNLT